MKAGRSWGVHGLGLRLVDSFNDDVGKSRRLVDALI